MYRDFYQLPRDLFTDTPDSTLLFASPHHEAVLQAILHGINTRRGPMLVSGEAGVGKTVLLRGGLTRLAQPSYRTLYIPYSRLSFGDLLGIMCRACGRTVDTDDSAALVTQFHQVLAEEGAEGREIVLVIDDAHNLPEETWTQLPLLADLRAPTGQPLHMVLVGQPALAYMLKLPALRPLRERLALRLTLAPLTHQESISYMQQQLAKVLVLNEPLFTTGALRVIARYARGNLRQVNILCVDALIMGALYQQKPISAKIVRQGIADYTGKRAHPVLRRGGVAVAGLLLVAGLLGGIQHGSRLLAQRGKLELSPPQPMLSELGGPKAPQSAKATASTMLPEPSEPPAPTEQVVRTPAKAPTGQARNEEITKPVGQSKAERVAESTLTNGTQQSAPLQVAALPPLPVPSTPPPATASAPKISRPAAPPAPTLVVPKVSNRVSPSTLAPARRATVQPLPGPVGPPEREQGTTSPVTSNVDDHTLSKESLDTLEATPARDRQAPPTRAPRAPMTLPGLSLDNAATDGSPRLVIEAGGHTAIIRKLVFTADARELISVSDDKTIRVWTVAPDGRRATLVRTIRGQTGEGREGMLAAAVLSPPDAEGRQRWLAVGGLLPGSPQDRYAIRLHDYASGEVVALLRGHDEEVLALAFAPTGRWLASAGKDRMVRLWDLATLQGSHLTAAPLVLKAHTDHVNDLAWSPTGDRLTSASSDHTVGLWDTTRLGQGTAPLVGRLRGHDQQVQTVTFHPEGTVLASAGKDHTIRLWHPQNGTALGVLARAPYQVSALAFTPDGRLVLAGSESQPKPDRLLLFAYPSGEIRLGFTGHQEGGRAIAFHPGGQWVATGGDEQGALLLWHAHTGEVLSQLAGRGRTIYAVGFSPDGRYLSWGHTPEASAPHTLGSLEYRFDLTQLVRLPGGLPEAMAIRAQVRLGALTLVTERSGPYDDPSRLHVYRGQQRLSTVEWGNTDGYRHSAYTFTPDGQGVLSGGMHGVLRLYTLNGQLRATLVGHTGEIKAVAVSTDGRWAVSGANDQTLRLWSLAALPETGSTELTSTLTLFLAIDGEWVAWRPEGFFAASAHGAHLLGYCVNQGLDKVAKYIPAEQLGDRLYRPELILTKLYGDLHKQPYSVAR